jgi:hypothetical protein
MKLNFQFVEGTSAKTRAAVCEDLRQAGAQDVHPLFPGESDPELGALQVAEVEPGKSQSVLKWLRARKEVAFAEEPVRRKLVR